jgi:RNase P subunit RPR2
MSATEVHEYRCKRCRHLLFKGTLVLMSVRGEPTASASVEPKCADCGLINHFVLASSATVAQAS